MTPVHEIALDSPEAWRGVWVRGRSGPTARGTRIAVERWHRVSGLGAGSWSRIDTACGRVGIRGLLWPSGGGRLEIARPWSHDRLPGEVCPRCAGTPPPRPAPVEDEVVVDEYVEDVLDDLATRVAERLLARIPNR